MEHAIGGRSHGCATIRPTEGEALRFRKARLCLSERRQVLGRATSSDEGIHALTHAAGTGGAEVVWEAVRAASHASTSRAR